MIINADQDRNIAIVIPAGQAVQIIQEGVEENREEKEDITELMKIQEKLGLTLPQVRRLLKAK